MTVEEAREFFDAVPILARKLQTLMDVGLSYIHLGQRASTTLSGGEAQRVKLSRELSKRDTGNTLYILDEPTTGLHFQDIEQLLAVLHRLRDQGNTIVVIEHNLDVIKTADWVVDLGPEGGSGGGEIVAEGTHGEQVAKNPPVAHGAFPEAHPGGGRRGERRRFVGRSGWIRSSHDRGRPPTEYRTAHRRTPRQAAGVAGKRVEHGHQEQRDQVSTRRRPQPMASDMMLTMVSYPPMP